MKDAIQDMLKTGRRAAVKGRLWVEAADGTPFLGPGPVELLERIAKTGSISKAAAEMGMSYKKAWTLINNLNAHAAAPIVIPQAGGEKGGGSVVTDAGRSLITYYHALRKRFLRFLEQESERLSGS